MEIFLFTFSGVLGSIIITMCIDMPEIRKYRAAYAQLETLEWGGTLLKYVVPTRLLIGSTNHFDDFSKKVDRYLCGVDKYGNEVIWRHVDDGTYAINEWTYIHRERYFMFMNPCKAYWAWKFDKWFEYNLILDENKEVKVVTRQRKINDYINKL